MYSQQANAAQQKLANTNSAIGQQDNLAQQQLANSNALDAQAGNLAQQQYQNTMNAAAQRGNIAQQQLGNTGNAISQQSNAAQQQFGNTSGVLGNIANLAQQQFGNTNTVNGQASNLVQQQYKNTADATQYGSTAAQQRLANTNAALGQAGSITQQQLSNRINGNSQNSGLWSNILNSAGQPISMAAAAQAAAQQPASNLWQMSLGLNSGGNIAALQSAAGKGTTTSTQTQSTSGGGMGGLFGGLFSGISYGLGNSLFCFPAGTMVKMADGTEKEIQRIEKGEEVLTDSGKAEKVIETMPPHYNDVYNIIAQHGHTSTTLTQPLMKPDGTYVLAGDLKIGTELKNVGKVQSIVYSGERRVYDLHVAGENNYIADGFTAQGGENWPE